MKTFRSQRRRGLTATLCASVLLWCTSPLFALDIFSSQKSGEQEADSPERPGALPSLADIAKKASPAVVNISTTQKTERRRSPRMNPMPGPGPGPGPNPFGGGRIRSRNSSVASSQIAPLQGKHGV